MVGRRVLKRNRRRRNRHTQHLLGSVVLLAAVVALVMSFTGSADADSAAASKSSAEPEAVSEQEEIVPWACRPPSVVENDPYLPDIHRLSTLIRESEPVDDSYFADVVFLGDSRTEGFKLYSGLRQGTFIYSVGATVDTVFNKPAWKVGNRKVPLLDAIEPIQPGKVYVMLGVNELGWVRTSKFHDRYSDLVDRLRADHPDVQIVLQSILPVSAEQEAKHTYVNNTRIREYNQIIRQVADEKSCWYADVAEAVTGADGCLLPDISFDGVHLNQSGCRLWLDYLRTHTV